MNILYISGNYENIQPRLMHALNNIDNLNAFLFSYDLRKTGRKIDLPDCGYYYTLKNHIHGPFPYIYRLFKIKNHIANHYRTYNLDLTHANMGFRDGFISYMLWKGNSIPYIISLRSTDLNARFIWKIPYIKHYCYKVVKNAKYIICLSDSYREAFLGKMPKNIREEIKGKIRIIPNGIDDYYLENKPSSDERNLGEVRKLIFVGKIDKNKNIEKVIEAVEILRKRNTIYELHVVGELVDKEYEELLNNKKFIFYYGKQPKEVVIQLYRQSDILVLPSHTETFGLVYVEAMSQGLPVIYTRGQGFDSEERDGVIGYAVSDLDAEDIANRIEDIYSNYREMSNNGMIMSRMFKWSSIATRISDLYRGVYS